MTDTLRVAVVGTRGHAARVALPVVSDEPRVTLVSVIGTDRQRTADVARRWGARPAHVDDPPESLGADAIWVTAPNHLHPALADRFLRAGLHVLLEKPLAVDEASATALMTTVASSDRVLRVAYQHRFRPAHRYLRDMLSRNAFGRVGRFRIHRYWRFPYFDGQRIDDLSTWRRDGQASGGWVINDIGSHLVDLVLWLFEDRGVEVVSAVFGHDFEDIPTDSSCALTCIVDGQIVVDIDCSNSHVSPGSRIEVYGSDGWARLAGSFEERATVAVGTTAGAVETVRFDCTDAEIYAAMLRDFVDATSGAPSISATAETALDNVNVIESARLAAHVAQAENGRSARAIDPETS